MIAKLEKLLKEKGWTQAAFEAHCLLAENRISRWRGGLGEPTARQAFRMARELGVPVEYLLDDDLTERPRPAPELSSGERSVLNVYRALRLTEEEAVTRLVAPLAGRPPSPPPPPRIPRRKRKPG